MRNRLNSFAARFVGVLAVVFTCCAAGRAFAALPDGVPAPTFHVDVKARSTMTIVTEGDVEYVERWNDASGGSMYATKNSTSGISRPWLGETEDGLPFVDFGPGKYGPSASGTAGALNWSATDSSVREVFLVYSDYPGKGGSFLLGAKSQYHFHRGNKDLFNNQYASANLKNGLIEVDGETVAYNYQLPEGFHIIHLRTTGNVTADRFGSDRDQCQIGAQRLQEVIVYNTTISDENAAKIYDYLDKKWIHTATFTVEPPTGDYVVTGSPILAKPVVKDLSENVLTETNDYTLAYENNVNPGEATVVVTGCGNHTGTVETTFTILSSAFDIAPIPSIDCTTGFGKVPSGLTVTNRYTGVRLVEGTDYTVSASNNDGIGTATAIVTGKGTYAYQSATAPFTITASRVDDENVTVEDPSVRMSVVNGKYVYVFTNAAAVTSVMAKRGLVLNGYLLVGGGGAGGNTMGGGGGGGGVSYVTNLIAKSVMRASTFTVQVGKGGTKGGTSQQAGYNGDPTTVTFGRDTFSVIGGGGGGGWGSTSGKTGGSGGGGAQSASGGTGTTGLGYAGAKGNGNSASGGGGGAGGVGKEAANSRAGNGGPGVTNSITGVARCYAGGGGGGGSNNSWGAYNFGYGGVGGGGNGGKSTGGSAGAAGTGGGGGGGGWTGSNQYGGSGGSGAAILILSPADFEIDPIPLQYVVPGGAKPTLVVRDPATLQPLTEGEEGDYVVSYTDNTAKGIATAMVSGRGAYAGKVAYATFEVAVLYHVKPDVETEGTGLGWDSPVSLTNAIAIAETKDRIGLMAGTYPIAATVPKITSAIDVCGGYSGEVGTMDIIPDAVSTITATGKAITVMSVENAAGATVRLMNLNLARGSRGLLKTGAGDLELYHCGILDNKSTVDGVGLNLTGTAAANLVLSNCVVAGNYDTSSSMKTGQGAYISTFKSVTIEDTLFTTNGIRWAQSGFWQDGRDAQACAALYLTGAPATLRRCRFVANRARSYASGGAIVVLAGNGHGTLFDHCAFYGNDETYAWRDDATPSGNASGGMLYVNFDSALRTVTLRNTTIAYNHSDNVSSPVGINVNKGKVVVENSIIANNFRCKKSTYPTDLYLRGSTAYAEIRNSVFTTNSTDSISYASAAAENITFDGVRYGDPLFVSSVMDVMPFVVKYGSNHERFSTTCVTNLFAFDLHLLSLEGYVTNGVNLAAADAWQKAEVNSPAIDAGRADADVGDEPAPNGGTINAGFYGGTKEASKTVAGDPAIVSDSLEILWNHLPDSYPSVAFTVGGTGIFSGTAVISITTNGTDWCWVSEPIYGLKLGQSVTNDVTMPLFPGNVQAKVVLSGAGNTHTYLSETVVVQGQMPAWWSSKGPSNVIHVWADAPGDADGTSWRHAVHDLAAAMALVTSGKDEIWLAGDFALSAGSATFKPSVALTIRGGFDASENEASWRAADAKTTINGKFLGTCFVTENTKSVVVERVTFLNGTRGFVKTGAGYLGLFDCRIENARTSSASGIGLSITGGSGTHVVVSNCVIRNNTGNSTSIGTGQGMYVSAVPNLEIFDTEFLENGIAWKDADFWNNARDGQSTSALYLTGTKFYLYNCRFSGNRASCYSNRGAAVRVNGGCNGSVFDHCRWVGNEEDYHWFDTSNPEGGNYSGAVNVELSNVSDEVTLQNCTIAYNHSGNKLSGAGITVVKGKAVIKNSIIANNVRGETCQVGADLCLLNANAYADVSYTMFTTNDPVSVSTVVDGNLNLQAGIVYGDPLFVTPYTDVKTLIVGIGGSPSVNKRFSSAKLPEVLAIDVHELSSEGYVSNSTPAGVWYQADDGVLSPAIDGGDPNDSGLAACEPKPNGGIVNMGVYGGTSVASKTPYGEPQVDGDITVTWDDAPDSRPFVRFKVGGIGAFTASAIVTLLDETGNTILYTSASLDGLAKGDSVICPINSCFAPGKFKVKVYISGAGNYNEYTTLPIDVEGELPPWWDTKGPDYVIHVRPGAYGANTGKNWRDAYSSFRAAFADVTSNKTEIWVSGTNVLATGSATLATTYPTVVRGGFRGWETTESARPAGVRSIIDGANVTDCLTLNNATNATIERMVFIRGQNRGLRKYGVGDLIVENCLFLTNGVSQNSNDGSGKGAYVTGTAGKTSVTFRDCLFKGNRTTGSASSPVGGGVRAGSLKVLRLEDDEFVHNGTHIAQPNIGSSYDASSGGTQGVAVYSDSPVSAERCRFVANFGCLRYELSLGGIVRLMGSAGGSAFTNCVFAGNAERIVWEGTDTWKEPWSALTCGGALTVYLNSFDGSVDVENCTFAHGLADGFTSPAGINIIKGAVNVHNSIFHSNRTSASQYRPGRDIAVWQTSSCTIGYTLFDGLDTNYVSCAETATTNFTDGVIVGNPQFATDDTAITSQIKWSGSRFNYNWNSSSVYGILENINVHPVSRAGYRDAKTGALVSTYPQYRTRKVGNSPAIDAGDPASAYAREGEWTQLGGNGKRVNLGAYGNTPSATMTPVAGAFLRVR